MFVHEPPPLVELSHLIILPVCPLNVSVPLLLPGHTVVLPLTFPPAIWVTVIVAAVEFAEEQGPL